MNLHNCMGGVPLGSPLPLAHVPEIRLTVGNACTLLLLCSFAGAYSPHQKPSDAQTAARVPTRRPSQPCMEVGINRFRLLIANSGRSSELSYDALDCSTDLAEQAPAVVHRIPKALSATNELEGSPQLPQRRAWLSSSMPAPSEQV